jgi:alpha-N-acetylglucosamine transferase
MEQSLLNYALRREGAMPWVELDYRWNANFVNMKDYEGGVAALHEKLWKKGPDRLRELWKDWREIMEEHYSSPTMAVKF